MVDDYEELSEDSDSVVDNDSDVDKEELDVDNINTDYELEREEPSARTAQEWKNYLAGSPSIKGIEREIAKIKPFERNNKRTEIIATKSLRGLTTGFCQFLLHGSKQKRAYIRKLVQVFGCLDMFHYVSSQLQKMIGSTKLSSNGWWNVYTFSSCIQPPPQQLKLFFGNMRKSPFKQPAWRKRRRTSNANDFEKLWLSILTCDKQNVALKMIPHVTNNILPILKNPFKTADFFFKMFEKGNTFAILSLAAIFKLITCHNFEYPNFYEEVYKLVKPPLFNMAQTERFLQLLDTFLSSSHIPIYIVVSFAKRLCRCLLTAQVEPIEPTLGLIRNLLTRHSNAAELIHRQVPATLSADPFDNEEDKLSKTNAMNTSLWELKLLQNHWSQGVRRRSNFVDKPLQKMESFVRYRCSDELFATDISKAFGDNAGNADNTFNKLQDGAYDEEEDSHVTEEKWQGKNSKGKHGKFQKRHEEKVAQSIAINFLPPTENAFCFKSPILNNPQLWCL